MDTQKKKQKIEGETLVTRLKNQIVVCVYVFIKKKKNDE